MAERIMAEVPPSGESGSGGPKVAAIAVEKTSIPKEFEEAFVGEPKSKTDPGVTKIENADWRDFFRGRGGTQTPSDTAASQEEEQNQTDQEQADQGGTTGPPEEGGNDGEGGGRGPEGPRGPEWLTPERG